MASSSGTPDGCKSKLFRNGSSSSFTSSLVKNSSTKPAHRYGVVKNRESEDDGDDDEAWSFQNLYERQRNKRRRLKEEDFQKKFYDLARRHQQLQNEVREVVENLNQKQSEKVRLNNLVQAKNKTVQYLRAVLKRSESLTLTPPTSKDENANADAPKPRLGKNACTMKDLPNTLAQIHENQAYMERMDSFLETTEKISSSLLGLLISASTSKDAEIVSNFKEDDDVIAKISRALHQCNDKVSEFTSRLSRTNSRNLEISDQLMEEKAKYQSLEENATRIQKRLRDQVTELESSYNQMKQGIEKTKEEKDRYRSKFHVADQHIHIATKRFEDRKAELKSDLKGAIDKAAKRKQEVLVLQERIQLLEAQLAEEREQNQLKRVETVTETSQEEEGQVKESDDEWDNNELPGALTQMVTSYGQKINHENEDGQDGNRVKELMAKARRLLEASVSHHLQQRLGVTKERTHDASYKLFNQINDLRDKCLFPIELIDAMHDMRVIGNASAHHGKPPPTRADAERVMSKFARFEQMFESGSLQTRTPPTSSVRAFSTHSKGVRFS